MGLMNRHERRLAAKSARTAPADTHYKLGREHMKCGRYDLASQCFDRALALNPDLVPCLINKGMVATEQRQLATAFASYNKALVIEPANAVARWNLTGLHLLTGNLGDGWAGREIRWHPDLGFGFVDRQFVQPLWHGQEPVAGKTILLHADEGLGDAIQCARYAPMVAARGARVILWVQPSLRSLLSGIAGVSQCLDRGPPPEFDLHCPLGSLPLAFGTELETVPSTVSYLPSVPKVLRQRWESWLGPHDRFRVGLVWSGSTSHQNDRNRSTTLQALSPILDLDATFVSLQKDPRDQDKLTLRERNGVMDANEHLTDFLTTAALVSCLDLVITVDTSVAHLAGGQGCPVWIMLPYTPDYRWLLDRDDTPWYPTARLFRQSATRDFAPVVERIRDELQKLISAWRPTPGAAEAPPTAKELYDEAARHMQLGQPAEAENYCRQALALDPGHADSLHLMGIIALAANAGRYDIAIEWFARAVRQNPQPQYLASLGTALGFAGRFDEALKAYDKALLFTPEDAGIWTNMGNILMQAKRHEEAALSFQHALKLDPRLPEAANGGGRALFKLERYEEALACFDVVNELRPNDPELIHFRATCLVRLNRLDEGLVETNRSLALNSTNAGAYNNLGFILGSRDRDAEAIAQFDKALALSPEFLLALNNKALSLGHLHRFDEALAVLDRARALNPDDALTRWNLAMLQLLLGDFESGWAGREWRWKMRTLGLVDRKFSQPLWLGDTPIDGKTVLLHSDEGLGDTLHFVRYAPMVAARGARVILQVDDPVFPALCGLPGVAECLPRSSAVLPEFDLHCPLTSLPLAFGTRLETIPSSVPYLPAPSLARRRFWDDRLSPRNDRLRVGLVWSGNPGHKNDRNRSIALSALAPLLDLEVTFISLQKGVRDRDRATLRERPEIIDPTGDLTDFAETAALVCCLDLVISVDTSVAHLAGGLACPVWILLPFYPDFRWLLGRDDSPWYPTARLFRQSAVGDWADVIERVRTDLQALIDNPFGTRLSPMS